MMFAKAKNSERVAGCRVIRDASRVKAAGRCGVPSTCHEFRIPNHSAFTLLELLIVVAIMGIVMTISVPFMNTAIMGNKGINGAMRLMQEACADARALAILRMAASTCGRAELRGRKTGWSRWMWRAMSGAWRIGRCPAAKA
jgi:prepilin-type N-terminal cleavage/methylation domain-containing protein